MGGHRSSNRSRSPRKNQTPPHKKRYQERNIFTQRHSTLPTNILDQKLSLYVRLLQRSKKEAKCEETEALAKLWHQAAPKEPRRRRKCEETEALAKLRAPEGTKPLLTENDIRSEICSHTGTPLCPQLSGLKTISRLEVLLHVSEQESVGSGGHIMQLLASWRNRRLGQGIHHGCSLTAFVGSKKRNSMSSWRPADSPASLDNDRDNSKASPIPPRGHLVVCVGKERQRFVIKTEYVNHPMFKILLEEAEKDYGFQNEGPLALPCQVAFFRRILLMLQGH